MSSPYRRKGRDGPVHLTRLVLILICQPRIGHIWSKSGGEFNISFPLRDCLQWEMTWKLVNPPCFILSVPYKSQLPDWCLGNVVEDIWYCDADTNKAHTLLGAEFEEETLSAQSSFFYPSLSFSTSVYKNDKKTPVKFLIYIWVVSVWNSLNLRQLYLVNQCFCFSQW